MKYLIITHYDDEYEGWTHIVGAFDEAHHVYDMIEFLKKQGDIDRIQLINTFDNTVTIMTDAANDAWEITNSKYIINKVLTENEMCHLANCSTDQLETKPKP